MGRLNISAEMLEALYAALVGYKSSKDSLLPDGDVELRPDDILAIVQDGQSRKIRISDLLAHNVDKNITIDSELNSNSSNPVANKVLTLEITDIKNTIKTMGTVINLKGAVDTIDQLPKDNKIGDLWLVLSDGSEYLWIYDDKSKSERWELVGKASISLENYYTKDEANEKFLTQAQGDERYAQLSKIRNVVLRVYINHVGYPGTGLGKVFPVTTNTTIQDIQGYVSSRMSTLMVDRDGDVTTSFSPITPESITMRVVHKGSNIATKAIDKNQLGTSSSYLLQGVSFSYDGSGSVNLNNPIGYLYADIEYPKGKVYTDVYSKLYAEYPKYSGPFPEGVVPDASNISSISAPIYEKVTPTRTLVQKFVLNAQRIVYAYPKYMGTLTSIKDPNNFELINGYDIISDITIHGIPYYVYISKSAPTSKTTLTFR